DRKQPLAAVRDYEYFRTRHDIGVKVVTVGDLAPTVRRVKEAVANRVERFAGVRPVERDCPGRDPRAELLAGRGARDDQATGEPRQIARPHLETEVCNGRLVGE